MASVLWLLGLFCLYVAIANIIGKVIPALRIRRRGLAWLALPIALCLLFAALGLSLAKHDAAKQAKQLLANPPTSDYTAYSRHLSRLSTSTSGELQKRLLAEIERIEPEVERERIEELVEEAEQLATVDDEMPASELLRRIKRIEEIAESIPKGADRERCNYLATVVMEAYDRPIMATARAILDSRPKLDTGRSGLDRTFANLQGQLLLDQNKEELQNEINRITGDQMHTASKDRQPLTAEQRRTLLAAPKRSYGELLRMPQEFIGKKIRRQGEVLKDQGNNTYRVATSKGYFDSYVDDDMLILISDTSEASGTRLMQGDIIDFAGTIMRPISQATTLGATETVPMISVEWIQLVRPRY